MLSEPLRVVAAIAGAFDSLGIAYLIGGSVASSLYGVPRATQDVDLVVDIRANQIDALTGMMKRVRILFDGTSRRRVYLCRPRAR